jgi:hypothetical protein
MPKCTTTPPALYQVEATEVRCLLYEDAALAAEGAIGD